MNIIPNSSNDFLYADYPTNTVQISLISKAVMAFSAQIIARSNINGYTSHFEVKSTFSNWSAPAYLVGFPTYITIAEDVSNDIVPKIGITTGGEINLEMRNFNITEDYQCVCYVRYTETL